jgi:ATP-dependent RNA helicase RhlE
MSLKYAELNLEPRLMSAIEKMGYQDCTPIQEVVIPHIIAGKDISGLAQTGTGKTAAFVIPLIDRILKNTFTDWRSPNFILILVPTRELAEQVYENVQMLNEFSGLKGVAVYGGTSYEKQKEAFRQNVEFVVATPGRLIDLYKEHFLDLKQVRAVVFDEADRMFDMGFKDDMKYILQRIPRERQFLVFSATLNFDVLNTAYEFGADPIEVNVSKDQARAENVKDEIFHLGHQDKPAYLLSLLKKYNPRQAIIFSNFKVNVERIASFLSQNGVPAMGISSLLTQAQRNRVIELFKADNEKNILVATDVAARGLDIKGVDMVINFELPNDAESYVHRIGRTGRAGAEGRAFSLVCDRDVESLGRVEDYLKKKLETGWVEDTEIVKEFVRFPREELTPCRSFEPGGDRPAPRQGGGGGGPRHRNDRPRRDAPHGGPRGEGARREGARPHREGGGRDSQDRTQDRGASAAGGGPRHPRGGGRRFDQKSAPGTGGAPGERPQHARAAGETNSRRSAHGQPNGKAPAHRHPPRAAGAQGNTTRRTNGRPDNNRPRHPQGARPGHASSQAKSKSTVQKVTGFFKKIFGGDAPATPAKAKPKPENKAGK